MPSLNEFLNNFTWKDILLTIFIFAIIIGAREGSSLGVFRRKKHHASSPPESPKG